MAASAIECQRSNPSAVGAWVRHQSSGVLCFDGDDTSRYERHQRIQGEPFFMVEMLCIGRIPTTRRISQLYCSFRMSKIVTDSFTWIKVFLVAFMVVGGFALFDRSNFEPFVPPEFGATGVLRGAVSSFFGYLGFDAMACVAGEAINAERNLPLSIMITLVIVTTLYVAAAIALVGMQSYQDISPESGFPGPLGV